MKMKMLDITSLRAGTLRGGMQEEAIGKGKVSLTFGPGAFLLHVSGWKRCKAEFVQQQRARYTQTEGDLDK